MDLTASTTEILVVVEALPEREQRLGAGLGTGIKQNADLGVQDAAESIEEPTMRVDLLAVCRLQAENELHRRQRRRALVNGSDELLIRRDGQLGGVLENVGNRLVSVNVLLDHTVLVDTNGSQDVEHVLVHLLDTVENHAHDNLLPGRATPVPEGRLLQVDNVPDVLHDAVKRSRQQHLVFVVVCDGNQQLGVAVVHAGAQVVTVLEGEVVGVAGGSRVAHLEEFLVIAFCVVVARLHGVPDGAGNGVVDAQDGALDKLDLSRRVALEATGGRGVGLLPLQPALVRVNRGHGATVSRIRGELRRLVVARRLAILGVSAGRRSRVDRDSHSRGWGIRSVRLGEAVRRDRADWGGVGAQAILVVGLVLVEKRSLRLIWVVLWNQESTFGVLVH